MDPQIRDERPGNCFHASLLRAVSDTRSVGSLYEILGGFCHKCRNTLNCLKLSLYLAQRQASPDTFAMLRELEPHYRAVEQVFERLQLICRPMALAPVKLDLALLIEQHQRSWKEWMGTNHRRLELCSPEVPAVGEFDPNRLGQGLDALIAWRAEAGDPNTPARLDWRTEAQQFRIDWREQTTGALESAERDPEASTSLALPLLSRVVTAHGGRVELRTSDELRIGLSWPLALPSTD
jgi:hypothetical protein